MCGRFRVRRVPCGAIVLAALIVARSAGGQSAPGIALYEFAAFYAGDLEISPGATMTFHGRVHSNRDVYLGGAGGVLTIGDNPGAGVGTVQVSAGGNIYRGTKHNNQCGIAAVNVDMLRDVVAPFGDLDPRTLPCPTSETRLVPPSELAQWRGTMAVGGAYEAPDATILEVGGPYWQLADLRIVLHLQATPPHTIEVRDVANAVDPVRTAFLATFLADQGWNAANSTVPGTAPLFYTAVPLATAGCGCTDANPSSCGWTNASCYDPPFGPPGTAVPGFPADTTRVYGRKMFDGDARRGGFYDWREKKWMLLLNLNAADLLRWNSFVGGPLFDPSDISHGGIAIFATVDGPDSGGINNYGVRIFGSRNLPIPGGIGVAADPTGLTLVSDQPLYVLGDYNRGLVASGDAPRQPASLVGDTINVLSNAYWNASCAGFQCRDGQSPVAVLSAARRAVDTRINAALLGGTDVTSVGNFNGGLQNFPRFHEDWSGVQLVMRESFVSIDTPRHARGAWCGTGLACNIYNAPTRSWTFEDAFLSAVNLPPLSPRLTCGNGTLEEGETCDDGNTSPGDCCAPTCAAEPLELSCADDGSACTVDACDGAGSCAHAPGNQGLVCRPAAGACDAPEECSGSDPLCPPDAFASAGTPCAEDGEPCTIDQCDGGGACVHPAGNAATVCRAPAGECDAAELCDGAQPSCPPDVFAPSGAPCADDGELCTIDQCNGGGACTHPAGNAGTVCRPTGGACDVAESCDGILPGCPADARVAAGTGCREAAHDCDAVETCDGVAAVCPEDAMRPDASPCDDGDACSTGEQCSEGICGGGSATVCDDGDACTRDRCAAIGGCRFDAEPALSCRSAGSSVFRLSGGPKPKLTWRWSKGQATEAAEFGDPTAGTAYTMCVYDAGGLILRSPVPPNPSGWRHLGTHGFRYRDGADGIQKMTLLGSDAEHSKVSASGAGFPAPVLGSGLVPPVVVQLFTDSGPTCWDSDFEAAEITRNDGERLKAKGTR